MNTIRFARVFDCFLVVIGQASVTDDEFDAYLDAMMAEREAGMPGRFLVRSLGGAALLPAQRAKLEHKVAAFDQTQVKAAFLAGSTFAQGVVTAKSRSHDGYRTFAPNELQQALAYLGVPSYQHEAIQARMDELIAEVS